MFSFIKSYFEKRKIKDYIDEEVKLMILIFSLVTYLDKKIKDIEIMNSDLLILNLFISRYPDINEEELQLLKKYGHQDYISYLKKFKQDEDFFELKKQEVLSTVRRKNDKDLNKSILKLINADGVVAKEESDFMREIRELI
jgi:uncharacterized protein YqgQ